MQPDAYGVNTAPSEESLCPNCKARPASTPVSYEETLFSENRVVRASRRRNAYSNRFFTRYGKTTLCAACATAYQRNVALRTNGRRLANISFAVMLVAGVVYLFLSDSSRTSLPGLVIASVVGLGALGLLIGLGMNLTGKAMRKSAAAFVRAFK